MKQDSLKYSIGVECDAHYRYDAFSEHLDTPSSAYSDRLCSQIATDGGTASEIVNFTDV